MAKQESFLPVRGTIGNLNFYRRNGEYLVRRKGGISKERILTDPNFARTRENMQQFKNVASAHSLFKEASASLLTQLKIKSDQRSLFKVFYDIALSDDSAPRGERTVANGISNPNQMDKFLLMNLTKAASTEALFPVEVTYNRQDGKFASDTFIPLSDVNAPRNATHMLLQALLVEIDFASNQFKIKNSNQQFVPLDTNAVSVGVTLSSVATQFSHSAVFILFSVSFVQESAGVKYPLNASGAKAIKIFDAYYN